VMTVTITEIPRLITATAEWAACMVFIISGKKRIHGWKWVVSCLMMWVIQSAFLMATGNVTNYLWLLCMGIAVMMMIAFCYICMRAELSDAVYCALFAFILAEFAASLEWQIYCWFAFERQSIFREAVFMAVIYGILFVSFWKILNLRQSDKQSFSTRPAELISVSVIAVSVFAISNLSFLPVSTPFSSTYGATIATIRTMVDFAGVAMMFANHTVRMENRMRKELNTLQTVLQSQYLQYQQSKESIDLINYKYHDLKHQIAILRAEEDPEKRNQFLNHMEDEIQQYEAQNKTGNHVVDTILTSKSVTCQKNGISLNCVADGSLLNFMDSMDICSILGNALDNAIECEKKIEDKEKRLIHVAIFSQKNFVILRFENYYEGTLEMREGVPKTTKTKRKELHGYGLKSIQYTVKKYDGKVNIGQESQWFKLKILIPMKITDTQGEALETGNESF
jgi:hypothetical protein